LPDETISSADPEDSANASPVDASAGSSSAESDASSFLGDAQTATTPAADGPDPTSMEKTVEETKPTESGAPESYADFSQVQGAEIATETLDAFKPLAKELNLTQEQAQKLLDFAAHNMAAAVQAPYLEWQKTQGEWLATIAADPETGKQWGTKQQPGPAQIAATRAITELGGDALRNALNITGAGSNPEIVRAFVKIGNMLSEPGFTSGTPVKTDEKNPAKIMYPNHP